MKKIILASAGILGIAGIMAMPFISSAAFSTASLTAAVDDLGDLGYGYVSVLITSYWPWLLGLFIIGGVAAAIFFWVTGLFRRGA